MKISSEPVTLSPRLSRYIHALVHCFGDTDPDEMVGELFLRHDPENIVEMIADGIRENTPNSERAKHAQELAAPAKNWSAFVKIAEKMPVYRASNYQKAKPPKPSIKNTIQPKHEGADDIIDGLDTLAFSENRTFDAVIIPAEAVRRWTEEAEKWNRIYEARGEDLELPLCLIQSFENLLMGQIASREKYEEQESIRLGKNILQFPDLKKAKRRKGQKLNTQSA